MSKGGGVQETAEERALAEIGAAQLQRWNTKWRPVLTNFAASMDAMLQPGSAERDMASGKVLADSAVQFSEANKQLRNAAATSGTLGTTKHKLAVAGMGDDQAMSAGLADAATDTAVTSDALSGLGAVVSLAQGQRASTTGAMGQQAAMAADRAASDAQTSLSRRIGNATLAGKIVGIPAGAMLQGQGKPAALMDPTQVPLQPGGGR